MAEIVFKPSTKLIMAQYSVAVVVAAPIVIHAISTAQPMLYGLLIVPALIALSAVKDHLRVGFTTVTISQGKLRYQEGMLSRATRTLELSKLQDVRVTQSLTQRMMGIGDLLLETAAESGRLSVRGIDNPQAVADRILDPNQNT